MDLSGSAPLPAFGGSEEQPQGWSACFWLEQDNDFTSYQYAWLSCAASSTDGSDAVYVGSRAAPSVCCTYDPYDVSAHSQHTLSTRHTKWAGGTVRCLQCGRVDELLRGHWNRGAN